jgi:predicted benzoate:H+ symporter BenE
VYLFVVSFATMAVAGLLVGLLFDALRATPTDRIVTTIESYPTWNVTTYLDIAFLLLMIVFAVRFLRTGGIAMLRAMDEPPANHAAPAQG